jgi:MFS family permease
LWRNLNFLILFTGQGISIIGTQISQVTFPLLILALTRSPAQAGIMGALGTTPLVLFSLPAGALIDRWNRKHVMIICDSLRTLALGSIALALLLNQLTFVHVALVAFCDGTLSVFFTLANQASIPRVVAKEHIPAALGVDQTLNSTSLMLGPALGPILYGLGSALPFLADTISTACSVISLLFIKAEFQEERSERTGKLWSEIREGLTWLWRHPLLRFLALLTFGLITPCSGFLLVLILQAQKVHATDVELGLILGGSGLGSILGSVIASPLYKRFGLANMIIATTWIWGLTWLLYAFAPNPLVLGLVNALSFIVVPIYMVVQYSCRMSLIPDAMQGRVNAVFRLIAMGSQPIGIGLTGFLLQAIGPVYTVSLLFTPQLVLGIEVVLQYKFLRRMQTML